MTKELELIERDLTKEAAWIGEDGGMAVWCKSAIGAWRKMRKLIRESAGEEEAQELKLEDISVGWFHLTTEEDRRENFDSDTEWYISGKKQSHYPVWVYWG